VPCASINDVAVSGPTQVNRAGQTSAASVSWIDAIATSIPRAIWPAGPRSSGAGSARIAGEPVSAAATEPSGSWATTTIGTAPPDQAESAIRRTEGIPSASARAESGVAARTTAATVTPGV
jgi:hypothetical protein